MRWRLTSPALRLFTQPFIQPQNKENIKASRHWPLCEEFTVNSPHKWPVTRKMFPFDDVIMYYSEVLCDQNCPNLTTYVGLFNYLVCDNCIWDIVQENIDVVKWKHFHVIGPLWGESIGDRCIPLTKASDAELWHFLWSAEQTVEQKIEMPVILWRHCNEDNTIEEYRGET